MCVMKFAIILLRINLVSACSNVTFYFKEAIHKRKTLAMDAYDCNTNM